MADEKQAKLIKRLQRAVAKLEPVPDKKVRWLRIHRPSVAMLLCLGSGPWKLPRRTKVQACALEIIGTRDLSDLTSREIKKMFPLEWQEKYLRASVAVAKHFRGFDRLFRINQRKWLVTHIKLVTMEANGVRMHSKAADTFKKPMPKVLGMFVRDYLFQDIVPVDRHVRKWLKDRKLPTHPDKILALFNAAKLPAREYARAMFLGVSSNPMHAPTLEKRAKRKTK